ncbi:hypothetical protein FBU31_000247 [Coemansia sp. 'formosensis']|nr:hypothetical protein FBU31_000247 [Coemansia sp. 'formosensis']
MQPKTRHTSALIQAQEFELTGLDIAQGDADINFVLFYCSTSKRHKKRPLPVGRLKALLLSAVQQFPIMLGRAVPSDSGLKVVVDPENLNWPDITEASVGNMSITSLQSNGFVWSHWPRATHTVDLAQRARLPHGWRSHSAVCVWRDKRAHKESPSYCRRQWRMAVLQCMGLAMQGGMQGVWRARTGLPMRWRGTVAKPVVNV